MSQLWNNHCPNLCELTFMGAPMPELEAPATDRLVKDAQRNPSPLEADEYENVGILSLFVSFGSVFQNNVTSLS